MGKSFDSEENLRKRFDNSCDSKNGKPLSRDPESLEDAYQIWKDDHGYKSPNDFDWTPGYPAKEATDEEIRESYERMYEQEGLDYDEEDDENQNDDDNSDN